MQSDDANRVVFRRLSPIPTNTGSAALRQSLYGPVPGLDARSIARLLGRPIYVPNWVLAAMVAATLGVSVTLSAGLSSQATTTSSQASVQTALISPGPTSVWPGSSESVAVITQQSSTERGQVALLQGQIQSMNVDLQNLQRQNDALRNLGRQQASDLTAERSNLAATQDMVNGQSQDLGGRLASMQQQLDNRVPGLQATVKAAVDVINQIRRLLGMPQITLP